MKHLAAAALVVAASAFAAPPGAEVELVRGGKRVELSPAARAYFAAELPRLFSTCSLDSRHRPKVFAKRDVGEMWQETQARDHLAVRLDATRNVGHPLEGAIEARELVLGLDRHPRYPEPFLSRNAKTVVAHTKCDGGAIIKFVCAPEVKPLMTQSYLENCSLLK